MDEYIEQLLAEMPGRQSTLHDVVRNIMDEPIPVAIKRRLLKPLMPGKPRPSRPTRTRKERKSRAILEETLRTDIDGKATRLLEVDTNSFDNLKYHIQL